MEPIVVGFDGSKPAMGALPWTALEAERQGSEVLVVQSYREPVFGDRPSAKTWPDPGARMRRVQAQLDLATGTVAEDHPTVCFSTQLVGDRPDRALVGFSEGASMVVVGHRGRGRFSSLLLGSVSQWIATRALSTVVVVRPSEKRRW